MSKKMTVKVYIYSKRSSRVDKLLRVSNMFFPLTNRMTMFSSRSFTLTSRIPVKLFFFNRIRRTAKVPTFSNMTYPSKMTVNMTSLLTSMMLANIFQLYNSPCLYPSKVSTMVTHSLNNHVLKMFKTREEVMIAKDHLLKKGKRLKVSILWVLLLEADQEKSRN